MRALGIVILTATLSLAAGLNGCGKSPTTIAQENETQKKQEIADIQAEKEKRMRQAISECRGTLENAKPKHEMIVKAEPWEAAKLIRECAMLLNDPAALEMLKMAEIRAYDKQIRDKTINAETRIKSLELLVKDYPDQLTKYTNTQIKLEKEIASENRLQKLEYEKQLKILKHREAAERRSRGVNIGMSPEEVKASSWGRPKSINTTTGVYGTHEQWVYGGQNYLYFENGRLTTIQN
ncbi:MAG: hypothetical protein U0989_08245 [Azonexus sp.]|nr:hypothetical protein [Azonexus sp.]MDZ4314740.1 hypothetical protein [Azonexus sp.]